MMKKYILLLIAICFTAIAFAVNKSENKKGTVPDTPFIIDLWQSGLPNSNGMEAQGYDDAKSNFKPCIKVYLPKSDTLTKAVVICPGGGYSHLSMSNEGYDWGEFFNEQGVAAIVLKYRMPKGHHEVPVSDATEAIRQVRANASTWHINPDAIGIMGFSAGGHLASTIATHVTDSIRPAFQILLYPVISMNPQFTHKGSLTGFLGKNPSAEDEQLYSNDLQVTDSTPRAFIALANDDRGVNPINSVNYYMALHKNNVPVTLHIYPSGGHGFGYRSTFKYHNELLAELKKWLKTF